MDVVASSYITIHAELHKKTLLEICFVFLLVALEDAAVNCCDSSLNSHSEHSTETRKKENFSDFASSLITFRIYSAEGPQPVCVETVGQITEGADPPYRRNILMKVCGDTLSGILNSKVSQTKLSVLHVQFSRSPLSNPTVDEKPTKALQPSIGSYTDTPSIVYSSFTASILLFSHPYCFLICSHLSSLFLSLFFLLASPISLPLSYPSLSLF